MWRSKNSKLRPSKNHLKPAKSKHYATPKVKRIN